MTTTDWRGRLDEKSDDDTPIDETLPRRREARSLLIALLRPFQVTVALLSIVVVVENIAALPFRFWYSAASTTASRPLRPAVRHTNSW